MEARNGDLDVGNCGKAKRDEESVFPHILFCEIKYTLKFINNFNMTRVLEANV